MRASGAEVVAQLRRQVRVAQLGQALGLDLPDPLASDAEGTTDLDQRGMLDDTLVEWNPEGYRTRRARPALGDAEVITPPTTVAVLRAGYPVQVDDSAG